jgi:hypothetical protein
MAAHGLTENHERGLLASFQYSARLIRQCEEILAASDRPSPLNRYTERLPSSLPINPSSPRAAPLAREHTRVERRCVTACAGSGHEDIARRREVRVDPLHRCDVGS